MVKWVQNFGEKTATPEMQLIFFFYKENIDFKVKFEIGVLEKYS